ncbi:zinc finger and SCAN domain-containing protein 21-like isoform X2 [Sphaeramia orbicularis]|uniref:zinc finger and SCAN domain-containing protein 21-like isoform X2 n=1 Tax=Sphaeramia orbicularis TaxID=375764 RepID=UPI00117D4048|nr:zinc finger and SCAN domain-containing protein 21-like isoform X2 [Sphaeramia orbicularis]
MTKKVQILRSLVEQRLIAAAEEIFGLIERTIAEYEEELCRTKEENQRQKQILDTVLLHTPDTHQQSVVKEELPPEQKEWSLSVNQNQNQEDPENHHIKEEQEELWTNQEADITKFPSTSVLVKSEDEEEAQSSQFHQRQTEKNREETDGQDCGGSEPARSLDPHRHLQSVSDDNSSDSSETEDSDCDWTETHRSQSGSESVKTIKLVKTDNGLSTKERPFPCSCCGKRFSQKGNLSRHMRYHTGEKPFTCSVCTKSFHVKEHLNRHMRVHTGEKPFTCNICGKCSAAKGDLTKHMRVHTREKPYICSVCGKSFAETGHLKRHMKLHTTD